MGTEYSTSGIGMGSINTEEHIEFLMDAGQRGSVISGVMSSAARDDVHSPASSPTTKLRKGLVCGRLTASPYKFKEYDNAAIDGCGVALGILMDTVNLLDEAGDAQDASVRLHVGGWYDEDKLYGLDANAKTDLKAKSAIFKEDWLPT